MAVLSLEQYQQLRTKVVGVADVALQGRNIIYQPPGIDFGTQNYGYDKLTDMSAAEIIGKYSPGSKDQIDLTRKSATVPILHKGFKVSRIDLASSGRAGEDLKAVGLNRASRKVAELEDDILGSHPVVQLAGELDSADLRTGHEKRAARHGHGKMGTASGQDFPFPFDA